jgi:hypothetical protein
VRRENFCNIACFDHLGGGSGSLKQAVLHERGGPLKTPGA